LAVVAPSGPDTSILCPQTNSNSSGILKTSPVATTGRLEWKRN